ncbi:hypothetical protein [Maricaulis sp.]|uniref:hypothetical protein n=1 Tax=Maricaulis sp. TaxID=1486257 RepID=UPI003297C547
MSRETSPKGAKSSVGDRVYTSQAELDADIKRFGRLALKAHQLPRDLLDEIAQAVVAAEYNYLDELIEVSGAGE